MNTVHVSAGLAERGPKEQLLPLMEEYTRHAFLRARIVSYDVAHAHIFMPVLAATELKKALALL